MPDRNQLIWLFFSLKGRISPAVYFLAGLLVFIMQAFPLYRFTLVPPESAPRAQGWALALLARLACLRLGERRADGQAPA